MRIRPRNYSTACAPSGDSAKLCRLAHVQCVTFFAHAERLASARQGRGSASPRIAHHTPRATHRTPDIAHHAPARGLPKPQRNNRTLPNNVARNSQRSFFDYVSKRCNSNAATSKFEIVARELRATLLEGPAVEGHEDYSSDGPDQHHTPQIDQTSTTHRTPRAAHHTPHTAHQTARTTHQRGDCPSRTLPNNVARNSPRSFFDYVSKRCNSNAANSKFEIVARELRATLMEDPAAPHGARRQARPAASRPSGTKTGSQSQKAP